MLKTVVGSSSLVFDNQEIAEATEKLRKMALVTTPQVNEGPLFAEVDMGADSSALTIRATVVQASTIFYDTPATLGQFLFLFLFQ